MVELGGLAARLGMALAQLHPTAPHHGRAGSCRAGKSHAGRAEHPAAPREHPRSTPVPAGAGGKALIHRCSYNSKSRVKKTPLEKQELQNISLVPPQKSKNESEKAKVHEKDEL